MDFNTYINNAIADVKADPTDEIQDRAWIETLEELQSIYNSEDTYESWRDMCDAMTAAELERRGWHEPDQQYYLDCKAEAAFYIIHEWH